MKIIVISIILGGALLFTACDKQQETATTSIPVTFSVNGMTCEGCAATVRETLSALDGVIQYDVRLTENRALVEFNPDVTSVSKIEAALKKTNFDISVPPDSPGQTAGR